MSDRIDGEEWVCVRCPFPHPTFPTHEGMDIHCRETHPEVVGSDGRIPVVKTLTMHLDGEDFYSNAYSIHSMMDKKPLAHYSMSSTRSPEERWG